MNITSRPPLHLALASPSPRQSLLSAPHLRFLLSPRLRIIFRSPAFPKRLFQHLRAASASTLCATEEEAAMPRPHTGGPWQNPSAPPLQCFPSRALLVWGAHRNLSDGASSGKNCSTKNRLSLLPPASVPPSRLSRARASLS
jgi:hypothetical protein